jgi:predicted DCC family thiol-disulfide oxidoreductase YuxK
MIFFRFVAIQSDLGQEIIKHLGIDTQKTDSIILFEPGLAYYYKSKRL